MRDILAACSVGIKSRLAKLKTRGLWFRVTLAIPAGGQPSPRLDVVKVEPGRGVQTLGSTQFTAEPVPWARNREMSLSDRDLDRCLHSV